MTKAFDIPSATTWVAPDLLNVLGIPAATKRSAVESEDLKLYQKPEKKLII